MFLTSISNARIGMTHCVFHSCCKILQEGRGILATPSFSTLMAPAVNVTVHIASSQLPHRMGVGHPWSLLFCLRRWLAAT